MKLHEHFLPADTHRASKEFWCVVDLLTVITKDIQRGDIELAKYRSTDLTKSLHELSKMAHKKKFIDRHNEIVQRMIVDGINCQVVRGFRHEN